MQKLVCLCEELVNGSHRGHEHLIQGVVRAKWLKTDHLTGAYNSFKLEADCYLATLAPWLLFAMTSQYHNVKCTFFDMISVLVLQLLLLHLQNIFVKVEIHYLRPMHVKEVFHHCLLVLSGYSVVTKVLE